MVTVNGLATNAELTAGGIGSADLLAEGKSNVDGERALVWA
jgi:hypothetical protein